MSGFRRGVTRRVKALLARTGYEIHRTTAGSDTIAGSFERYASRIPISTVIDVGASDGRWAAQARRAYPDAEVLLIEAQRGPHGAALERLERSDPKMHAVLAAAGDAVGEVHFDTTDPMSGVASHSPTGAHDEVVPMTTIDHEVETRGLAAPFLVKLDTHGFEVPILDGAAATLSDTHLLIIEAYNFELELGSLRFHELCAHLEALGFRSIDLVDTMRRPGDGVLWQMDLVFARADRPEFGVSGYS